MNQAISLPPGNRQTAKVSPGSDQNAARLQAHAGLEMDTKIAKRLPLWRWLIYGLLVALLAGLLTAIWRDAERGRSFSVSGERISIAPVTLGTFEDFIPVRARVTPLRTLYLDAIEGGRVERILVEDGAMVEAGQLLVELSNTGLQLSVMRNEAEATQQLNNMRTIELQLEQNRLAHKRNLVEIDYQIVRLQRQAERQRTLFAQGNIARSTLDEIEDELRYYQQRRAVTLESQTNDLRLQEQQLAFLRNTSATLEQGLTLARANLDKLRVRAPVAGKVSGFNVELGQSIQQGGRLGQIDDPQNFKLSASIDEFYLGRVDLGQEVSFERDKENYRLRIAKIYPQVKDGQFEVDMVFSAAQPQDIRRGQTLQTRLTLGDASSALLIPNGAFYQDTGGNWIFVVAADGTEAIKRTVRLGRRNNQFIEVLEGLDEGEQVVTSPYTGYQDIERLKLSSE